MSAPISVADHYLVFPSIPDHIQRLQEVDGRGVWMIALTIMRLIFILLRLNLTEEEEAMVDFSDDEGKGEPPLVEWVIIGKVLSRWQSM